MKMDRLIGILSILLQKDKVTAAELSEKFEVSRRTIIRDIEAISKAGIPVVVWQGRNGGISIMENFKMDRTLLSTDKMKTILAGLHGLESVGETERYRRLMDKLSVEHSAMLKQNSQILIDLSSWDKSRVSEKIEFIKSAMEDEECISFSYCSRKGESCRRIEPWHLIFQWSDWYVWGYCPDQKEYRLFKLTRLSDLKRTGEKRKKREVPAYNGGKHFQDEQKIQAVIQFDEKVKWRILDEYGPEALRYLEDGSIVVTVAWSDRQSLYHYLLTFGDAAEILSPEEYRIEFVSFLNKIAERYKM